MIEGLHVDVPGTELRSIVHERATHHERRADWYRSRIYDLKAGGVEAKSMSNDPISGLENSAKGHEDKASYFHFLERHIVVEETYRLDNDALRRLEIITGHW